MCAIGCQNHYRRARKKNILTNLSQCALMKIITNDQRPLGRFRPPREVNRMSLSKGSAAGVSLVMVAVALLSPTVCAQTVGTIYGQVTDPSNAVVVGATVKGRNLGTTLVRSGVTNVEGSYLIPSLPP